MPVPGSSPKDSENGSPTPLLLKVAQNKNAFACRYPWRRPVAWTWRARLPSRGGPAGRQSRRLRPEWAAGQACANTRASMGSRRAGSRRRRRAGGPPAGVAPDDRRRLDLVVYGASRRGEALCCAVEGRRAPATGLVRSGWGCHQRRDAAKTMALF